MASMKNYSNNNVFTMQTVQIQPFRTVMTALKDILLETNVTFEPDGIRIINMDKSHTVLVHMHLEADKFEFYECKKEKIIIGCNMFHLFKLISQIENDDTLIMYVEESDYDNGIVEYLTLKFENGQINQCKTIKLKLIDPEHDELEVPDVPFSTIINLPSTDFQKIIRDLSCVSEKIEIQSVGDELQFKCVGQFASVVVSRIEDTSTMKFSKKQDSSKVIQGEFSLKNLGYFIKCTQLCPQIEMYLENNLPLVVKYNVASLGFIRLGLVPLPSV
jgi:proliferating cell nuclear antigen